MNPPSLPSLLTTALPRVLIITGAATDTLRDAARDAIVSTVASRGTDVAQGEVKDDGGAAAFVNEVAARAEETHLLVLDGGPLLAPRASGTTVADLAQALRYKGISVGAVIVTGVSIGAINHVALNEEALRSRQVGLVGTIVVTPGPLAEDAATAASLVQSLAKIGAPFLGVIEGRRRGYRG